MLVIVVYDIPNNKRRTKLSNLLEGYGRRVQFSVFECFLNFNQMQELYEKVSNRVVEDEDNVRFLLDIRKCSAKNFNYW